MKSVMLRWLYGLKKPLIVFVFAAMLICMIFGSVVPAIIKSLYPDQIIPEVKGFNPSSWAAASFIGMALSVIGLQPLLEDYRANGFGKYIAVMPLSRGSYLSAGFIYFGATTFVCSLFSSIIAIVDMITLRSFDISYLIFGVLLVFFIDYIIVMLIIFLSVAIESVRLKIIIGIVLFVGVEMLFMLLSDENNENMQEFLGFIANGNHYFFSLGIIAVSAPVIALLWMASVKLFERREL